MLDSWNSGKLNLYSNNMENKLQVLKIINHNSRVTATGSLHHELANLSRYSAFPVLLRVDKAKDTMMVNSLVPADPI